jgi:glutaredoxin
MHLCICIPEKTKIMGSMVSGKMSSVTSRKDHLSHEEKFVDDTINGHCVVVFAKSECPYSRMAKDIFDSMKVPYKAIDIDLHDDGQKIQQILGQRTNIYTVIDKYRDCMRC